MSSETLSYFFKNEDIKLKARFQVALQCAPFLKGLKISSVITMEQKMCEELQEIFEETEVEYRILSCRDSRCLVFFFRRSELEYHLMLPDNQRLLEACLLYTSICCWDGWKSSLVLSCLHRSSGNGNFKTKCWKNHR